MREITSGQGFETFFLLQKKKINKHPTPKLCLRQTKKFLMNVLLNIGTVTGDGPCNF